MATIANSGEDIIHSDDQIVTEVIDRDLEYSFELNETVHRIQQGNFSKVGLQFPDELLYYSVAIYKYLRARLALSVELYVLADTTYGACCVDEVAGQHVDADLIVHYGHACLTPTARLPVIYILTKRPIDSVHAAASLTTTLRETLHQKDEQIKAIILMYDVAYAHAAAQVYEALVPLLPEFSIILSRIDREVNLTAKPAPSPSAAPTNTASTSTHEQDDVDNTPADGVSSLSPAPMPANAMIPSAALPRSAIPPRIAYDLPEGVSIAECAIFYLGSESLGLNNLLICNGKCNVWSYDPVSKQVRLESNRTNKMLMRRYAMVEKAKDADVIGILVGTLGVAAYLPLITHLRQLIASHHKKSYTVAVGKLNPAKLANFMEVECFVLVACPENTLIDSKEFLRPIVTPFELELALTSKSWTGDYVLDFTTLLSSPSFGQDYVDPDKSEDEEDGPVFSSAKGSYRHPKKYDKGVVVDSADLLTQASALSIRDTSSAVARILGSAGGEFLSQRSYKGLEPRYGLDAPAVVEDGRSGIARGYGDEKEGDANL